MLKCTTCNKEIKNPYRLDGKVYGYNCYKMALSLKLAMLQEIKNSEWNQKCFSLVEVLRNKEFKDSWNNDFKMSILEQWDRHGKMSTKQFNCIIKKFNKIEYMEYLLILYDIIDREVGSTCDRYNVWEELKDQEVIKHFKNDERIFKFIKDYKNKRIKRLGKQYCIVTWNEIEDKNSLISIMDQKELTDYVNDEYIVVHEVIDII